MPLISIRLCFSFTCAQPAFPQEVSWAGAEQELAQGCPTASGALPWSQLSCSNAHNVWDKSADSWLLQDLSPPPPGGGPICHFTFSALGVRHLGTSEERLYKCIQKRSLVLYWGTGSGRQKSWQCQKRTSYSYTTGMLQSVLLTATAKVSITTLQGGPAD